MNKKKLSLIITLLFCLCPIIFGIPLAHAQNTSVSLSPSEVQANQVGETFDLTLGVENVQDLFSWKVVLVWDKTVLELVSSTEGSFLKDVDMTMFLATDPSKEALCSLMSKTSASGSGTLANFTFEIIDETVETWVNLTATELLSGDSSHTPIDHVISQETKVSVVGSTKPIAYAGDDQQVDEGTTVTFDGSGSVSANSTLEYSWSFVDGEQKNLTGKTATHIFQTPGTYEVTLTITNENNQIHTDNLSVEVMDTTAPIAQISSNANSGQAALGAQVIFDASDSEDLEGGKISSYLWNFGDGTTSTTDEPQIPYTYKKAGTYVVTVTVTDMNDNKASDGLTLLVGQSTPGGNQQQSYSTSSEFPTIILVIMVAVSVMVLGGSAFWLRKTIL